MHPNTCTAAQPLLTICNLHDSCCFVSFRLIVCHPFNGLMMKLMLVSHITYPHFLIKAPYIYIHKITKTQCSFTTLHCSFVYKTCLYAKLLIDRNFCKSFMSSFVRRTSAFQFSNKTVSLCFNTLH